MYMCFRSFLVLFLICIHYQAFATYDQKPVADQRPKVFVLDTFDDEEIDKNPSWWTFGQLNIGFEKNKKETNQEKKILTKSAIQLISKTSNWFFGGFGRYLGVDMSPYKTLKLVIFSPKENSAMIRVQLFDDDNGNWFVDQEISDQNPNKIVSRDDIFTASIFCNWKGWKVVSIPLTDFKDSNPGIGDDVWNPHYSAGSGGLLQVQLLFFSSKDKNSDLDIKIDSMKFTSLGI